MNYFKYTSHEVIRVVERWHCLDHAKSNKNGKSYIEKFRTNQKDYFKQDQEFYSRWHNLQKGSETKTGKGNNHYTGDSNFVTQLSTNPTEQGLTLVSRREAVGIQIWRRANCLQCVHWNWGYPDNENQSNGSTETTDSNIFKSSRSNTQ